MTCRLSVVIPTYGRARQVCLLVERLLRDLPSECEIVVVAQGVAPPPFRDDRVRMVARGTPNLPAARNCGIDSSRGGIVLFLDDDCEPSPGLVARHIELHERHPEFDIVAGGVHDDNNRGDKPQVVHLDMRTLEYVCDYGRAGEEESPAFPGGHSSLKRAVFDRARYDPWFRGNAHCEEVDLALRLRRHSHRILFSSSVWIDHFLTSAGGCRSEPTKPRFEFNRFYNRALCWAKNSTLRHLRAFLTKQKYDLEYLSRRPGGHDPALVSSGCAGTAGGVTAGLVRRHAGAARFR